MRISTTLTREDQPYLARATLYAFLVGYVLASLVSPNGAFQSLVRSALGMLCLVAAFVDGASERGAARAVVAGSVLSVIAIVSAIYTSNTQLYSFIWVWTYLGPALAFSVGGMSAVAAKRIAIAVATLYLMLMLLGWDPGDVVAVGSRNNISVYVLFYSLFYCYVSLREGKTPAIFPIAISLVVCMWAEGRSGFIASALLFAVVSFSNLYAKRKDVVRFAVPIAVVTLMLVVIMIVFQSLWMAMLERFNTQGIEDLGRIYLLEEYFSGLFSSAPNLLLGVPFSDYSWLTHFDNPHNSLIMLHSRFGIIGFLLVTFSLIKATIIQAREFGVFVVALVAVGLLRALTDSTCFTGLFDVFWWLVILDAWSQRPRVVKGEICHS